MGHSVEYALNRANKALKKGANTEAEKIFQSVLEVFPGNQRAKEGLKKIEGNEKNAKPILPSRKNITDIKSAYDSQQYDAVIQMTKRFLEQEHNNYHIWNLRGAAFGKLGKLDEALDCFVKAKELSPTKSSLNNNIGSIWREKGDYRKAIGFYEDALSEDPNFSDARTNLAACFHKDKQFRKALEEFNKLLISKPDDVEILNAMAAIYKDMGRTADAVSTYKHIISLQPDYKQVHNNMGNIHLSEHRFEEAIEAYETALKIDPEYSDAMNNLGNTLKEMSYLDEAIHYYKMAIEAPNPKVELYSNLGVALKDRGLFNEALENLDLALSKRKEEYPDAEWNKALVYLSMGDFCKGWDAYEWRWKATNFDSTYISTSKPVWTGKKERVLIWPEQGIGDQIMFSTMFEEFAEFCSIAIFQVDRRLLPIFRRTFPQHFFIPNDRQLAQNEYDSHIPMGSLAKYLRTSRGEFAKASPTKLKADTLSSEKIRQAFRIGDKHLMGISWRSVNKATGLMRSVSLSDFLKPLKGQDIEIVNLQYGDCKAEIKKAYEETGIAVKSVNEIDTFSNIDHLASLIHCCDSVITIDNSTVHLAAAMGKPTNLLLPFITDWRWNCEQEKSIWYDHVNIQRAEYGLGLADCIEQMICNIRF